MDSACTLFRQRALSLVIGEPTRQNRGEGSCDSLPEFGVGGRAFSFLVPPDPPGQREAPKTGRPLVLGLQPGVGLKLGASGTGLGGSRRLTAEVGTPAPPRDPRK